MKYAVIFVCLSLFGSVAQANELAATCATLQMQVDKLGGEQAARDMGLGSVIDMCSKEDTSSYKEQMSSGTGTLYCSSGDLCASYDFTDSSDRDLYLKACTQVASCASNYMDKCTVNNDKVKGGVGTVDWTIYSYGAKMPAEAKKGHCS